MMVQKLDNMMWRVYEQPLNDVINVVVGVTRVDEALLEHSRSCEELF